MNLVIDDQAPVAGLEKLQVGVHTLTFGRDDLIGGDGDGPHLLA